MRAQHPGPSLRGAWGLGPGEASCHAYLAPALQGMAYVWICSPQRPLRSSASALCQPPHGEAASHCKLCQPLRPPPHAREAGAARGAQGGAKRYEGAWRQGRRHGQGTEWYPSGEVYSGARGSAG